jgi:lipid A disaccharide synthetase
VVPELVQHHFTAENVVPRLRDILPDGQARDQMIAGLVAVKILLQGTNPDRLHPAERAAEEIAALLKQRQ